MTKLTNTSTEIKTINSREVAEMLSLTHNNLLQKLNGSGKNKGIVDYLKESTEMEIHLSDFFIESSYLDSTGRTLKCYEFTRKGCEMLANKLTGKKGVEFTAKYINKFHEMEQQIQSNVDSYQIQDPIERAKRWIEEEMVRQGQAKLLEQQKPKVEYHDKVLAPVNEAGYKKLITVTDVAKDLGMTARTLNKILNDKGILFKTGNVWKPYKKYEWLIPDYMDYQINEYTQTLKFTEKGRKFLIEDVFNNQK